MFSIWKHLTWTLRVRLYLCTRACQINSNLYLTVDSIVDSQTAHQECRYSWTDGLASKLFWISPNVLRHMGKEINKLWLTVSHSSKVWNINLLVRFPQRRPRTPPHTWLIGDRFTESRPSVEMNYWWVFFSNGFLVLNNFAILLTLLLFVCLLMEKSLFIC